MNELVAVLPPLLLVDVLNPVLFAALIFVAGSTRPVLNSSAMLLGHTLAYIVVGVVLSLGMEQLRERLANPRPVDFLLEFILAVGAFYAAFASRGGGASEERNPKTALGTPACFGYGALINFIGAPFALPYLAAVDRILEADLSTPAALGVLIAYNLAYALPFALVPGLVAAIGERARPILERINDWLVRAADLLMPWLLFAIGLFLLTDVAFYLLTGEPIPLGE